MLGLSEEAVAAEYARQKAAGGTFVMPPDWRRRVKEAQARHGTAEKFTLLAMILVEGRCTQ